MNIIAKTLKSAGFTVEIYNGYMIVSLNRRLRMAEIIDLLWDNDMQDLATVTRYSDNSVKIS